MECGSDFLRLQGLGGANLLVFGGASQIDVITPMIFLSFPRSGIQDVSTSTTSRGIDSTDALNAWSFCAVWGAGAPKA